MLTDSTRAAITPFWHRIPRFFLYPLHPSALVVLLGSVALFAVLPVSLLGALLRVVLGIFFVKYCFEVLEQTSEGRLRPPALTSELFTQRYEMPFKLWAVLLVLGVAQIVLERALGAWAAVLFGLLLNVAYPAVIMVLATSGSLRTALDPSVVGGMMFRIGWPYLVLVAFLLLLSGGVFGLVALLGKRVSIEALLAITGVGLLYFTLIMFNLMGYVVYQYHEALGLSAPQAEGLPAEEPHLEQFRRFMAEEKHAAALEELRDVLNQRWGDLELHRMFHKLAKLIEQKDLLVRHGREFLAVLLEQNRLREAMEIYQDLVAADPSFRPALPDQYLPIAQMLRDSRQPKLAVALINGFHKRFPDSALTVPLYLLAAKIFHEDLADDARATQILRFLSQQYPRHASIGAVTHYLRLLEGSPIGRQPA